VGESEDVSQRRSEQRKKSAADEFSLVSLTRERRKTFGAVRENKCNLLRVASVSIEGKKRAVVLLSRFTIGACVSPGKAARVRRRSAKPSSLLAQQHRFDQLA
jgi:hypothetical protein